MGVSATNPVQIATDVTATREGSSDDKLSGSGDGISPVVSNPKDDVDPKEERAFDVPVVRLEV
ncbi:hypothetical protein ColLi_01326 [Colletotrichum liriopes]|uniref:Uncharacterized protein n=1 Tax=Colletotrichum liriopes TaxID=708192 RepID=A0AA37GDM5_9PEZI|nr:hypothetical protein ColLi_01326 [Colletotrichum liriopes]